jgi:hypothetical protein
MMTQKNALAISAMLSAFVLVTVGGLASYFLVERKMAAVTVSSTTETAQIETPTTIVLTPTPQAQIAQRSVPTEVSYPVSAEAAAAIAQLAASGAVPLSAPQLGTYNGSVAYQVQFSQGVLYISATSGQVLYSSIVANTTNTTDTTNANTSQSRGANQTDDDQETSGDD